MIHLLFKGLAFIFSASFILVTTSTNKRTQINLLFPMKFDILKHPTAIICILLKDSCYLFSFFSSSLSKRHIDLIYGL